MSKGSQYTLKALKEALETNALFKYIHYVPQGSAKVILTARECVKLGRKEKLSKGTENKTQWTLNDKNSFKEKELEINNKKDVYILKEYIKEKKALLLNSLEF